MERLASRKGLVASFYAQACYRYDDIHFVLIKVLYVPFESLL